MSDIRISSVDERDMETVLEEDVKFSGELRFQGTLMVKGKINGSVQSNGKLYISEKALVEADILADLVSIRGHVIGSVLATSVAELGSTAVLEGDISSPELIIESGCYINGVCSKTSSIKKNPNFKKPNKEFSL